MLHLPNSLYTRLAIHSLFFDPKILVTLSSQCGHRYRSSSHLDGTRKLPYTKFNKSQNIEEFWDILGTATTQPIHRKSICLLCV
ncbi:unnamed protein product [Callosobruchus maculatus]|uniref:Uncharacterized protein n=1 Tax=Callosobruchus maculatus TaxID=64391 RepID=A0A653CHW8_CALMS|nr:unnamed protein product [Callosobruchus maculatus]